MIPLSTPLAGLIFTPIPSHFLAQNILGGGAGGPGGQRPPATPPKEETA